MPSKVAPSICAKLVAASALHTTTHVLELDESLTSNKKLIVDAFINATELHVIERDDVKIASAFPLKYFYT